MTGEIYIKEIEAAFKGVLEKMKAELQAVRSNRPSVEIIENIQVTYYESQLPIKQLASLGVVPPREIHITPWDKNAMGPIMKAIQDAKIGLTVSSDDKTVRASLPQLTDERREEFMRLAKKLTETFRIQVRNLRDEAIKKVKAAEDRKEMNEDEVFKAKEKIQKAVDQVNKDIEGLLEKKLKELSD